MEIRQEYIQILKEVLRHTNLENVTEEDCRQLGDAYESIEALGIEDSFYEFLWQEYQGENQVAMWVAQYLYQAIEKPMPLFQYMERRLKIEEKAGSNPFTLLNIDNQLHIFAFANKLSRNFMERWNYNRKMSREMKGLLQADYSRVPLGRRDSEFVVLLVPQLLPVPHAPSKLVLEMARIIKTYLKKDVFILNVVLETEEELLDAAEIPMTNAMNYLEEWNGMHKMNYNEIYFDVYQIVLEQKSASELGRLISEIRAKKPLCVWSFSAIPAIAGVMKGFTTLIHTSTSQGYAPVDADIMVNYIPTERKQDLEAKGFLEQQGVKIKETEFLFPYAKPEREIERSEFKIPREAFLIGIVGARLTTECTSEFMEMIHETVNAAGDIYILFIGDVTEEAQQRMTAGSPYLSHYKFIGKQTELMEHLALLDLFVNPPRMGGGNSGAMALALGKPVVTLGEGDVAAVAGKSFAVETLRDYPKQILRYKEDKAFYDSQSKKALERISEITTSDEELAEMIQQVFDMIQ